MPIFEWEQTLNQNLLSLPHSGIILTIMEWASDLSKSKWLILFAVVVFGFVKGWRKLIHPLLLAGFSVLIGDLSSRRIIKAFVMRPRPHYIGLDCHVSSCWGFVSSHATNIVAVATVLILYDRRNVWFAAPIAIVVCLSRLYLADHFPLDVLGGIILGCSVGFMVWRGWILLRPYLGNASE